jgi:hypothetical protein
MRCDISPLEPLSPIDTTKLVHRINKGITETKK